LAVVVNLAEQYGLILVDSKKKFDPNWAIKYKHVPILGPYVSNDTIEERLKNQQFDEAIKLIQRIKSQL
jgi:uncharacterized membrane-anchored protein